MTASFFCLIALLASPALDWLVTSDGGHIATKGPWKVEGKRVVFQLTNGNLSSVRVSEVDLEASRRASEPAVGTTEAHTTSQSELERAPRWLLTTSDLPTAAEEAPALPEPDAPSPAPRGLHVSEWRDATESTDPGARIRGRLAEGSFSALGPVTLRATLLDANGEALLDVAARVAPERPGWPRDFEALFPGVFEYDRIDFEPARPTAPEPAEDGTGSPVPQAPGAETSSASSLFFSSSPSYVIPLELGGPRAPASFSEMPS